ncbi:MAG: hypothetical protein KDB88_01475 [Flavobacteriales bacterium]|nr:hypothetical protein [Flavobacteriales bacterium]
MRFLSDRVSMEETEGATSVVISARLKPAARTLLVTWTLAWTLCGAYMMWELIRMPPGEIRQYLLVFMAFWLYFEIRIGRALLWRLYGFELLRIKDGVFTIKDSIWGFGTARDHFLENVNDLRVLDIDEASWKWQMNESFWVIGGERLQFEHLGRTQAFGKGLTAEESRAVLKELQRAIGRSARRAAAGK